MDRASSVLMTARRLAGLSQRAAAAVAGVRQPLLSRIESGRQQPTLPTLQRLTRACGYALRIELEPLLDPHDLSLLDAALARSPEQRVERLVTLHRTARELREAVGASRLG